MSDEIFVDDDGDIFMEEEEDLYAKKEVVKRVECEPYDDGDDEDGVDLGDAFGDFAKKRTTREELYRAEATEAYEAEEKEKKLLKPATKQVRRLLTSMLIKLNEEHDCWQRHASSKEIEETHTGAKISPRFELEFFKKEEIEDYGANVGLHDLGNEESEHGSPSYIALEMMSIRYFSGYHKMSCGI
jgi:hypothetical protein